MDNSRLKSMAKKVIVYSTPTCPYCKMTKEYFVKHKVVYQDIDVSADQKAAEEMIQKSGQMGVPVIEVEGKIIIGFDQKRLAELLGLPT